MASQSTSSNPAAERCLLAAAAIGLASTAKGAPERSAAYVYESVRSQIIRASSGTFRSSTVSAQLIESVPANTMANLTTAGNGGS
jgi:hypothetical protein